MNEPKKALKKRKKTIKELDNLITLLSFALMETHRRLEEVEQWILENTKKTLN